MIAAQRMSEPDTAKTCQQLPGSQAFVLLVQAGALACWCINLRCVLGQPPSATLQVAITYNQLIVSQSLPGFPTFSQPGFD